MILIFEDITFKNFLSYGNAETTIKLNDHKHTIITGKNGQGKSSCIIDTLSYVLYDKPYRKISKSQLINTINKKNLLVQVNFRVGVDAYKVIRGQKPNVFQIFKNSELIQEDAANKDYQEFLETNILKINFKTFKQIIVIGSAGYIPFMSLTAADRRSITEDVLDITVFSNMLEIAKTRLSEKKSVIDSLEVEMGFLKRQISSQEEMLKTIQTDISLQEEENSKKVDALNEEILSKQEELLRITEEISALEKSVSDYSTKKKKQNDLNLFKIKQQTKKENLTKTLDFYNKDVCPTCEQEISVDIKQTKKSNINQQIYEINNILDKIDETSASLESILSFLEKSTQKYSELNQRANTIRLHELNQLHRQIDQIKQKKTSETKSLLFSKDKLNVLKSDLIRKQDDFYEHKKTLDYIKICCDVLKDNGVKAKIMSTFIPLMNKLINEYLQKYDLYISFELDEMFNETIKSRFRDSFSYNSFSEGEKTKINLSILFAWRKIAMNRNSVSTNLLIFDEVLDSSMDAESVGTFVDILNGLEEYVNSIVISHREIIPELFDRHIVVEKLKDFSILKEN